MTKLSVNVNKVATLRNTRPGEVPSVTRLGRIALEAGAHGLTIHPRPDQRHIRAADVEAVAALVRRFPGAELNVEGNPFLGEYMAHARRARPDQCTLVPDATEAATSDHGWDLSGPQERLREAIAELRALGCRVSLFMDAGTPHLGAARALGADRIELYTGPYAHGFAAGDAAAAAAAAAAPFAETAREAAALGLGINAGHDLNRANIGPFLRTVPGVLEVSIGHALIADALELGLAGTVGKYLAAIADGTSNVQP